MGGWGGARYGVEWWVGGRVKREECMVTGDVGCTGEGWGEVIWGGVGVWVEA